MALEAPTQPRLLLHACCGPCATVALERLLPRYAVTVLWYNPNLYPAEDAERRREAVLAVAGACGVEVLTPAASEAEWLAVVAGLEAEPEGGRRCTECFRLRLGRTADLAASGGFTHSATTLSVGPQKKWEQILALGEEAGAAVGVQFVAECFRREGGFARSVALSKELGLYRQNYCGCRYSVRRS
jgi:epoxyqueuosine reductase